MFCQTTPMECVEYTLRVDLAGAEMPANVRRAVGWDGFLSLLVEADALCEGLRKAGWDMTTDGDSAAIPYDRCGFDTRSVDACNKVWMRVWIEAAIAPHP